MELALALSVFLFLAGAAACLVLAIFRVFYSVKGWP
jgi:hypothetical protein